jgi:hypothetical protein
MSGTKAHEKRKADKRKAEHDKLVAINENRTSLLQMTIAELIALYGEENVNASHPLFSAIQSSANGAMIDLPQLASDITEFNTEEVVDV